MYMLDGIQTRKAAPHLCSKGNNCVRFQFESKNKIMYGKIKLKCRDLSNQKRHDISFSFLTL
jgi:hypothetical protein